MDSGEDGDGFRIYIVVSQKRDFADVWAQWMDKNLSAEGTGKN